METTMATSIVEHFSSLSDPRILLKTSPKLIDIVVIALCPVTRQCTVCLKKAHKISNSQRMLTS